MSSAVTSVSATTAKRARTFGPQSASFCAAFFEAAAAAGVAGRSVDVHVRVPLRERAADEVGLGVVGRAQRRDRSTPSPPSGPCGRAPG